MCKYYPWLHFLAPRASLLVDVIVVHLCKILLEPDPESEYEPHATQLPPTQRRVLTLLLCPYHYQVSHLSPVRLGEGLAVMALHRTVQP